MAKYSVPEIFILLQAVGIKAGIEAFDKRGFLRLKESIFQAIKEGPYGVEMDERYLKESVFDQLVRAGSDGKQEIGLNSDYVDTLCFYLGYNSYNAFSPVLHTWEKRLQTFEDVRKPLAILFDKSHEVQCGALVQKMDLAQLSYSVYPLANGEDIRKLLREAYFGLVHSDPSLWTDPKGQRLYDRFPEASSPFILYLSEEENDKLTPELEALRKQGLLACDNDLHIILSLARFYREENKSQSGEGSSTKRLKSIKARNVGAIIFGDPKIDTEHFANRDINITYNKGNKEN